jgi:DNA-binding transcriptional ArsR family regulator
MATPPQDDEEEIGRVLTALAEPTRREILRDLDTWVGADIAYLREERPQSRQAIHKHLEILIAAGIVIKSCRGRTALYYMNPQPIRRVFAILARRYKRDQYPLLNLFKYGTPRSPFD